LRQQLDRQRAYERVAQDSHRRRIDPPVKRHAYPFAQNPPDRADHGHIGSGDKPDPTPHARHLAHDHELASLGGNMPRNPV